jgi:hypothetical protein
MMSFFKRKETILSDGYTPYGNAWERDYRDGFNNLIPGKDIANDPVNGVVGGKEVVNGKIVLHSMRSVQLLLPYAHRTKMQQSHGGQKYSTRLIMERKFNYYGNTARMLSLFSYQEDSHVHT